MTIVAGPMAMAASAEGASAEITMPAVRDVAFGLCERLRLGSLLSLLQTTNAAQMTRTPKKAGTAQGRAIQQPRKQPTCVSSPPTPTPYPPKHPETTPKKHPRATLPRTERGARERVEGDDAQEPREAAPARVEAAAGVDDAAEEEWEGGALGLGGVGRVGWVGG